MKLYLPFLRCIQIQQHEDLFVCNPPSGNILITPSFLYLIRVRANINSISQEGTVKVDYIGRLDLPRARQVAAAFCIKPFHLRDDDSCPQIMLLQSDSSFSLYEWESLSMTEDLAIDESGQISMDKVEKENTLVLNRRFYAEQDLAFTEKALFFQETHLGDLEGWREYDSNEGSIVERWRQRIALNSGYLRSALAGVWGAAMSGEWKAFFAQDKKHRRFLGLSQDIIALTQEFKLHKVDWEGLKTLDTVDVFDLLNLRISKEDKKFKGSKNGYVATWLPIVYFLKTLNNYKDLPPNINEEMELDMSPKDEEDERDTTTFKVDVEYNKREQFLHSCDIIKDQHANASADSFFLTCQTSENSCPMLVAKISAQSLKVIPMQLSELRRVMLLLEKTFDEISLYHLRKKIPFPFNPKHPDVLAEEEASDPNRGLVVRVRNAKKIIEGLRNEKPEWSLHLDPKTEFVRTFRNYKESGASMQTNQVSGILVLQRVSNANIMVFTVLEPSETPNRSDANVYVLDAGTGRLLRRLTLASLEKREIPNFKFTFSCSIENGIYFMTFKLRPDGPLRFHSLQIFRREIRRDIIGIIQDYFKGVSRLPKLDFLSEEDPFVVLDRAFRLPPDALVVGTSKTRSNVSEKHFLISLPPGQVFALPLSLVSPQRLSPAQLKTRTERMEDYYSSVPKKDRHLLYMMEEFVPFKSSRIAFPAQVSLTKDLSREEVASTFGGPTLLESTTLLLFGGNDWTAVPFAGDGRFDAVNSSFDKGLLILGFCAMILVVFGLWLYDRKTRKVAMFNE